MRRYTNSLHKVLDLDLRDQIDAALLRQPPGMATIAQVYAGFGLKAKGISPKALERYSKRLWAEGPWFGRIGPHHGAAGRIRPTGHEAIDRAILGFLTAMAEFSEAMVGPRVQGRSCRRHIANAGVQERSGPPVADHAQRSRRGRAS